MKDKDCSGLASLLDAEKSLLPQQRTLYRLEMREDVHWVKLRPAAREFLHKLAQVGELTAFTFGHSYAPQLAPLSFTLHLARDTALAR